MTARLRLSHLSSTVASCSTKQLKPPAAPFRRHASWRSGSSLYENAPFPQARRTSVLRPVNFLVCLVPIFTFSLGIWQVKRLRWKVDLIDEVQRNIEREPMVLPPNINIAALPDFAFRRVLLKGVIASPPLFLGPIVEHGAPGSYIIQPFIRSDGSTVLLNRGFVTVTRADAIRAGKQVPQGMTGEEVVIEGMISKKFDEGKGWWAHDNEPENNLWFWKDIKGMADWVRSQTNGELGEVQPVLVDAIDRGENPSTMLMQAGIPVGRPPTVELRNQHATYAMTWFSLSFATAGMLAWLLTRGAGKKKLPKVKRYT